MMHRRWFKYAVTGLILCVVIGTVAAFLSAPLRDSLSRAGQNTSSFLFQSQNTQTQPIALGMQGDGFPNQGVSGLDAYANLVGGAPAAVDWYPPVQRPFDAAQMDVYASRGIMPVISLNTATANISDAQITAGVADSYYHAYARAAAAWNKPFMLRLDWEMNGIWYPYSPKVSGNTDASYIAMWRHVVDLFRADGATKVLWAWVPNTVCGATCMSFESMYPGSDYVDYVGLDGYNWGKGSWQSFTQIFAASYDRLVALAPGKPVMIGEVAAPDGANAGGNKASWITSAFMHEIPSRFPLLKLILWFNFKGDHGWNVDSSPSALQAFRQVVSSPLYKGGLTNIPISVPTSGVSGGTFPVVGQPTPVSSETATPAPGTPPRHGIAPMPLPGTTPPSTNIPTPTVPSGNTIAFESFENGMDNWATHESSTDLQTSTDYAQDGKYSLQVMYENIDNKYHPAGVDSDAHFMNLQMGQTVSTYIYVPDPAQQISAHIYVQSADHTWHSNDVQPLETGKWNLLVYTIPTNLVGPIIHVGIQFVDQRDGGAGSIYIDSLRLTK